MKDEARTLLTLAKQDAKAAKFLLDQYPNIAAFLAQQSTEKSAKAFLRAISTMDEEKLAKKIKHDSILAVLQVLSVSLKRVARESGMDSLFDNLKSQRVKKKEGWEIAWLIASAFNSQVSAISELFEDFKLPYGRSRDEYWTESLDPNLQPKPTGDPRWIAKLDKIKEEADTTWQVLWSILGIKDSEFPGLMQLAQNSADAESNLRTFSANLRVKGNSIMADSVEKGVSKIGMLLARDNAFLRWLQLIVAWSPYFDAHAVRARYPRGVDLDLYNKNKKAVENLVEQSEEIADLTRNAIYVLTGE